jgi:hypothetical protein
VSFSFVGRVLCLGAQLGGAIVSRLARLLGRRGQLGSVLRGRLLDLAVGLLDSLFEFGEAV